MDKNKLLLDLKKSNSARLKVFESRKNFLNTETLLYEASAERIKAANILKEETIRLQSLESGQGALLIALGKVKVYEFWIETPEYSGSIIGITAKLTQHGNIQQVSDVTGNTRGGLGGAAAGGLLLGPVGAVVGAVSSRKTTIETTIHEVDHRQFELEILGHGLAWSNIYAPTHAENLRKVRNTINSQGSKTINIKALIEEQKGIVNNLTTEYRRAQITEAEKKVTRDEALIAKDKHLLEYSEERLSLINELHAQWLSSNLPKRIIPILLGPIITLVWVAWMIFGFATKSIADIDFAIGISTLHALIFIGVVIYYFTRVRPFIFKIQTFIPIAFIIIAVITIITTATLFIDGKETQ